MWIIGAGVLPILVVTLVVVLLVLPTGAASAKDAILERVQEKADPSSAKVLISRRWGDGRLVLASYESGKDHKLALGFTIKQARGWRVAAYTDETVEKTDVVVGSLLIASSEGGAGQPPWSAAAGELRGHGIAQVEVRWASGDVTSGTRRNDAYLVVQEGTTTPLEARYLGEEGAEVAKIPIEGSD